MRSHERSGTFELGDLRVRRLGYGAMHLSGPGIFGPPQDRDAALAVLREAVAAGVNHIDTSDYYGPHITNQLIREALHPYPDDLVIVTKIGARRGNDGSVLAASSPDELIQAVHQNLRNLDVEVLDVVNLRNMFDDADRAGALIEAGLTVLADLQRQGLVRHIGLSNVTPAQIAAGRRSCDDRIAYVPFFPLGGFAPLQSSTLSDVARHLNATTAQVALAWLLRRAPNILLIPGTSSLTHLRENIAAAELNLPDTALEALSGGAHIASRAKGGA
jgi:aryl-alcohol dehydrogenase-like predicted oxidoreductase